MRKKLYSKDLAKLEMIHTRYPEHDIYTDGFINYLYVDLESQMAANHFYKQFDIVGSRIHGKDNGITYSVCHFKDEIFPDAKI